MARLWGAWWRCALCRARRGREGAPAEGVKSYEAAMKQAKNKAGERGRGAEEEEGEER